MLEALFMVTSETSLARKLRGDEVFRVTASKTLTLISVFRLVLKRLVHL